MIFFIAKLLHLKKGFTLSSFVKEVGIDGVFKSDNLETRSYSSIKFLFPGSASRAKRKLDRVYSCPQ